MKKLMWQYKGLVTPQVLLGQINTEQQWNVPNPRSSILDSACSSECFKHCNTYAYVLCALHCRDDHWIGLDPGNDEFLWSWFGSWLQIVSKIYDWNLICADLMEKISGVKRNFWLAKFLTSHHVRMHRVNIYIPNTLIKLIV